jgi:hypothetical protein
VTSQEKTCRVCAAKVPDGALRCPNCQAALGDMPPCPHCRATAGASPDKELRYRCDVCGGPRVPRTAAFRPSGKEVVHLRAADAARKARAGYRAASVASGVGIAFVGLFFLFLLLIFGLSFTLALTSVFVLAPVVAFFLFAVSRAGERAKRIAPALDAAWVSVANDVANETAGVLTATDLAAKLGIEEAQAEELVALLDVNAIVSQAVPPQLRIGARPAAPAGVEALAEEEAAAAEAESRAKAELKR